MEHEKEDSQQTQLLVETEYVNDSKELSDVAKFSADSVEEELVQKDDKSTDVVAQEVLNQFAERWGLDAQEAFSSGAQIDKKTWQLHTLLAKAEQFTLFLEQQKAETEALLDEEANYNLQQQLNEEKTQDEEDNDDDVYSDHDQSEDKQNGLDGKENEDYEEIFEVSNDSGPSQSTNNQNRHPQKRKLSEEKSQRGRKRKKQKRENDEEAFQNAADKMTQAQHKKKLSFLQPPLLTGGQLKDYQLEGLRWLVTLFENGLNGILADEMGLGKTIQVIALIAYLRSKDVKGPFIIIAPLATLPNWINEFKKWAPSIECFLYHGTKQERMQYRRKRMKHNTQHLHSFPVIVTSYEIAITDRNSLEKYKWKYMVVDEGQRIKNINCRLIRELKKFPTENRLLLSGTPIQNTLEELWSLLNFVNPQIFDDLSVFQSWFGFRNIGKETSVDDILNEEEKEKIVSKLHEILRPFLMRRLKKDVLIEMPPKKEFVVYAGMTELQRKYYKLVQENKLKEQLIAAGIDQAKYFNQLNQQMNFRKVCNHPFLFGEPKDENGKYVSINNPELLIETCGKMRLLNRILLKLKENGHKTLIFSQMTEVLNILEDYFVYRGWRYCRIDGAVHMIDRQSQIESFNSDPDVFAFLLSTRAGGVGLNLSGADTCIIYDSDWNPHQDHQAQDRCHRIGQTKSVLVYRLLTVGSIEIDIMERQNSKKKLERMAVAGGEFNKLGRRELGMFTLEKLRTLLTDDIDLSRIGKQDAAIEEISEEELHLILDRVKIFQNGENSIPVEGQMYDVVTSLTNSMIDELA